MNLAPIALFVYKRPDHTRRSLEALKQCPEFSESPLYVFCDGPKGDSDRDAVEQTRAVVKLLLADQAVIHEAEENQGLAQSIIAGVTQLVNTYKRVIVLEDDLLVSPSFLCYMNQALDIYEHDDRVMQISGYMFPVPEFENLQEAMFLPFTVSWGWGTWQRAWQFFDPDAKGWQTLIRDKEMRSRFDLDDTCRYFHMLKDQASGSIDSWAIRWYWSVFQRKGYVLFPSMSHITNIGFDGSGTHGSRTASKLRDASVKSLKISFFPEQVEIDTKKFERVKHSLKRINSNWISRFKKLLDVFTSQYN